MFDRLPQELILLILEHAVSLLLVSDRTALTHLAQSSKAVYEIVAPQMYQSICVPRKRSQALLNFAAKDLPTRALAERVFKHARSLHMTDCNLPDSRDDLFQHFEHITADVEVVKTITATLADQNAIDWGIRSTNLRSVHLCSDRCESITWLAGHVIQRITHLCGWMVDSDSPSQWQTFLADPSNWMATFLNKLPALTHLGLNLYCDNMSSKSMVVEAFDLNAFAKSLRMALSIGNGRLTIVAVRVAGLYITRWDQILVALQEVERSAGASGRVRAWRDDRVRSLDWDDWIVTDALAKRSIWTECLPVASIKSSLEIQYGDGKGDVEQ